MPTPDKPTPISLDLDALDREGAPEPFVIKHGGKRIVMIDPHELDWRDLMDALTQPRKFFDICMSPSDAKKFAETKLPGYKLQALMNGYMEHHGIPSSPEAAALPTP